MNRYRLTLRSHREAAACLTHLLLGNRCCITTLCPTELLVSKQHNLITDMVNVHAMVHTEMQYITLSAQIAMNILHFLKCWFVKSGQLCSKDLPINISVSVMYTTNTEGKVNLKEVKD